MLHAIEVTSQNARLMNSDQLLVEFQDVLVLDPFFFVQILLQIFSFKQ